MGMYGEVRLKSATVFEGVLEKEEKIGGQI